MSRYMSLFHKRLTKMQEKGFIIPSYILHIKSEKTARKYTMEKIASKSKFIEKYGDAERVVSGKRGLELLRREAGKKAYETVKKRKSAEEEFKRKQLKNLNWVGELPAPTGRKEEWESRKGSLKARIQAIIDSFESGRLANELRWLFEHQEKVNPQMFWSYLLDLESSVISKLEEHARIKYADADRQDEAYNYWKSVLNFGEVPTLQERQDTAEELDKTQDNSDMTM